MMRGITDLPIYELDHLCSYLDFQQKYNLSRTSPHLERHLSYRHLWHKIEAETDSMSEIEFIINRMNKLTKLIKIRGKDPNEGLVPSEFFYTMCNYNSLTVLVLENQNLRLNVYSDRGKEELSMNHFPDTLQELSLRGVKIRGPWFFNCHQPKTNLRVLILDECPWISNTVLHLVSKYFPNLEILSLYHCLATSHIIFRYFLETARNLKILDARFLSDVSSKQCFSPSFLRTHELSLQALYIDVYRTSCLGLNNLLRSGRFFNMKENSTRPKSTLYVDPYNECTCGYQKSVKAIQGSGYKNSNTRKMSLRNFDSDIDLTNLLAIPLDVLDLTGSQISEPPLINYYQKLYPNCRIIYEGFCVCLPKRPQEMDAKH